MLSVQSRLREIASARVKAYAGLPLEPEPLPVRNHAELRLPLDSRGDLGYGGFPVYLLADALLQLPADAKLVRMEHWDYGRELGLLFESRDFPEKKDDDWRYPRIEMFVEADVAEIDGRYVRRIRGLKFLEAK